LELKQVKLISAQKMLGQRQSPGWGEYPPARVKFLKMFFLKANALLVSGYTIPNYYHNRRRHPSQQFQKL
jgi:hypothetical protein